MSRDALNNAQFDLMVTNERDVERKRRQDRAGNEPHPGTVSGSKRCEVCGEVKPGVAMSRRTGLMTCNDCYKSAGDKGW